MIGIIYGVPLERIRCRCCNGSYTVRLGLCAKCLDRFGRWRRIRIREEFDYSSFELQKAKLRDPAEEMDDDDPRWLNIKFVKAHEDYLDKLKLIYASEGEALGREYEDREKEQNQLIDWLAWIIYKNPPWFHKFKVIHDKGKEIN